MTMKLCSLLALLACVLAPESAHAESDAQLWTSAGVQYRINKKVRVEATQHVRLDENISQLDSIKTELSSAWKINKGLRLGGGYRLSMNANKDDELEPVHRLFVQGQFKGDVGPVSLSYRLHFQEDLEKDDELEFEHTIRNKLGAEYDTDTPYTPSLSLESFTELTGDAPFSQDKLRLTTGLEIRPEKAHVFDLFYRLQVPMADPDDPLEHIIGLGYQYRLRRPKKK